VRLNLLSREVQMKPNFAAAIMYLSRYKKSVTQII
jgi:hypothetical protein